MTLQTKISHSRVSAVLMVFMLLMSASCRRGLRMGYPQAGPDRMSGSWTNAEDYISSSEAALYANSACVIHFRDGKHVYLRFLKANLRQSVVECGTLAISEEDCLIVADSTTNVVKFAFNHGAPKFVCGGHSILWFAPNTIFFSPDMLKAAIVSEHQLHQGMLSTNLIDWIKVDIPPM